MSSATALPMSSSSLAPSSNESPSMSLQSDLESPALSTAPPEAESHSDDSKLQKWMEDKFCKLGNFVVRRPWQVIIVSVFFGLVLFAGVFSPTMKYENRSEYLWVPTDSLAYKSFEYNDKVFSQNYQQVVLVTPDSKDENLLTKDVFDSIWALDKDIRAITLDDGATTFEDVCRSFDGECYVSGVLNFWEDFDHYNTTVFTDADLISALSSSSDVDGFAMPRASLFGKYDANATSGDLEWAYGTMIVYLLDEDNIDDSKTQAWEDKFLKVCGVKGAPSSPVLKKPYPHIHTYPFGYRSLDAELTRVVTIDIPLVMVEYFVMFVFVSFALSYGQSESKVCQSIGCIMSVILSTMAAYGVCAAAGIPMSQLVFILPFILVGIGVDDGVVIISSYRHLPISLHGHEEDGGVGSRVATALGRCSLSIVYTTATDVAAFSLGCLGTIPAVRYFCAYAAVAVALDFVFQVTFFVAVVAIDERRSMRHLLASQEHKFPHSSQKHSTSQSSREESIIHDADSGQADVTASNALSEPISPQKSSLFRESSCCGQSKLRVKMSAEQRQKLALRYVEALTSPQGITLVLLSFFGFVALCSWGITNLSNEFSPTSIVPDDSYVKEFFTRSDDVGLSQDQQFDYSLVFKGSKTDIADSSVQLKAIELVEDLALNTKRSEGPASFWLTDFLPWAANQSSYEAYMNSDGYFDGSISDISRESFEQAVSEFLTVSPYNRYEDSVVLNSDGAIRGHRAQLYHYNVESADDKIKAMLAAYKTCDNAEGFNTKSATPYSRSKTPA